MIAIPSTKAISTLFVFFAVIPATRALIIPGKPSDMMLGKINERRSVPGKAFMRFSTNLCLDSISPIKSPPNLKEYVITPARIIKIIATMSKSFTFILPVMFFN